MKFRRMIRVAAVLGFATMTCAAAADPVTVGFRVNVTTGPLAGSTSTGTFTYDSSIAPAGGGEVAATGLLTDLAFTFNGIAYDETSANTGSLDFDAAGNLLVAFFGTNCGPALCNVAPGTNQFLVLASFTFTGIFAYVTPGTSDTFDGDAFLVATVAEPGTMALLLAGLAVTGFVRRRERAVAAR